MLMATKAAAKKTAAKRPPAKKAAAASAKGNTDADAAAAAAATVKKVEPRKDLTESVPPVTTHDALNAVNEREGYEKPKTEVVDVEFISVHQTDPNRRIPGPNPYLDDLERERAEIVRAKVEDREPDLENPPAVQGTPLAQKEQFIAQQGGYGNTEGVPTTTLGLTVVKD